MEGWRSITCQTLLERVYEAKCENFSDVNSVIESFMALFNDQPEFENETAAKRYLDGLACENDEGILNTLSCWAQSVVAAHLESEPVVTVEASTPADLLFKLQPYTHTNDEEQGVRLVDPWPLVSVIDFSFDNPLLNEDIIFVDSPGISDANFTRAENAIRHHRKCTHKLSVADIARVKDDKSLRENLASGYRLRGSGHTVLVITKGDSIDSDGDVPGTKLQKCSVQKLKDEARELRNKKGQLAAKRQKAPRDERMDIDDELEAVNDRLQTKTNEHDALIMRMRNRSVVNRLSQQYRELTGDPHPLGVFVVGNEAYKTYQAGYFVNEKPSMTIEETGIPALRKKIYLLPAEGKLNNVLHIARTQLPSLINSFELYCSKTHMARKSEIEKIVHWPKGQLPSILDQYYQRLKEQLTVNILSPMTNDEHEYCADARRLCAEWTLRHSRDHLKIMQKYGCKKGTKKTGPDIDWNAQLMKINSDALEDYLYNFSKAASQILDEMGKEVGNLLDTTKMKIRGKSIQLRL